MVTTFVTKKPFTPKNIFQCLYPLRAKWQTIGFLLDIDEGTLAAIKADNDTVEDQLREMITTWMNQVPSPTSVELADAVDTIDQRISQRIRNTMQ